MIATILAHIVSLIGGWVVSWLVGLTFGLLNVGIAATVIAAGSYLFIRLRGATAQQMEPFTTQVGNALQFVTGGMEGFAKIFVSLFVFSFFERQPGLVMLGLFMLLQFIPMPSTLPESQKGNMRAGAIGTVLGLIAAWWLYYPKN